ncbi:MAG: TetR family transcriptional regulator [Actinomycetales bacterium]|nr:TetR family transcriptional regulator [Actinomycetales bacterium]
MATSAIGPVPNETRRERSITHLLDVAERLFVERGYAATPVERVASDADLTKGSVYFYFTSKEGLLDALLTRAQETVFSPSLAILDEADGSATERLARYFNYLGATAENTGRTQRYLLVLMVSLQLAAVPETARTRAHTMLTAIRERVERVIRAAQKDGEISADVPAAESAAIVQAMTEGMLLQWHQRSTDLDGQQFLRAGRTALLTGLLTSTSTPLKRRPAR